MYAKLKAAKIRITSDDKHGKIPFLVGYVGERPWWPIQRKKEESKKLREERDQIKFIDLRFKR